MAPVRRYLRITNRSVLECRIYLENPALTSSWLLNERSPALPRIFDSVRPLIIPKLREESENAKGKGRGKKLSRAIKDVVIEDDFEVSIFLKDLPVRHSVMMKQKILREPKASLRSNSDRLTGGSNEQPIDIQEYFRGPTVRREDSEADGETKMRDAPEAVDVDDAESGDEQVGTMDGEDDKKKLGMSTAYDGFSIWERVLCLIVKRRPNERRVEPDTAGQALMKDWIHSTQAGFAADNES